MRKLFSNPFKKHNLKICKAILETPLDYER